MILGHVIALDPTRAQIEHIRRAVGTARYAYNWGLAEWKRRYEAGENPSATMIKAAWNAHRKRELPWSYEVTKCASGQAIIDVGAAFANFFRDLKRPKGQRRTRYPKFKKKRSDGSFALWNDQFDIQGRSVRIARLGWVRMRETLRFAGKIMAARVFSRGGRWFLSVQVDGAANEPAQKVNGAVVGVDLGITTLATLSTGEKITGPKARRRLFGRIRRLQRRISLQKHRAKKASRRQLVRQMRLTKLHARIANIRKDATHKLTTMLVRCFDAIVVENLNVSGMSKNHVLAGSILDGSFGEVRRQIEYKSAARGGRVIVADRFFPSSKKCHACDSVNHSVKLGVSSWACFGCGSVHDRDVNASLNLERLGLAMLVGESPQAADDWYSASSRARSNARGHAASLHAAKHGESGVDEPRTKPCSPMGTT